MKPGPQSILDALKIYIAALSQIIIVTFPLHTDKKKVYECALLAYYMQGRSLSNPFHPQIAKSITNRPKKLHFKVKVAHLSL